MAVMNQDGYQPVRARKPVQQQQAHIQRQQVQSYYHPAHGGPVAAPKRAGKFQRNVNLAGGLISLGLMLGGVWWAYDLAVRDVSGVPVVLAMEGPMRVAPSNPGGELADHMGLAVNSVAAVGQAAPVAEQLVLAPKPVDLTMEDGPGLSVAGAVAEAPQETEVSAPAATGPELLMDVALTEALAEPQAVAEQPELAAVAIENNPDLAGMRPRMRPGTVLEQGESLQAVGGPVVAQPVAPAVPDAPEVQASAIQPGTWLVQIGAFDDVEGARGHWAERAGLYPAEMSGKTRVVQEADVGGQKFVRLRVDGFADKQATHDFCTAMLAKDLICIPVLVE
jgi:hypothetical protein